MPTWKAAEPQIKQRHPGEAVEAQTSAARELGTLCSAPSPGPLEALLHLAGMGALLTPGGLEGCGKGAGSKGAQCWVTGTLA